MPLIHLETLIAAPIERCFDLMRDVDVHTRTTARTRERVVGGKLHGLLEQGDEVTREAVHFGIRQPAVVNRTSTWCSGVPRCACGFAARADASMREIAA